MSPLVLHRVSSAQDQLFPKDVPARWTNNRSIFIVSARKFDMVTMDVESSKKLYSLEMDK
jgi:hypothetical protein